MDFKDQVRQLGGRVVSMRERVETEEATKNAFIMPFIQLLGFDVFDPSEIVPEFTCDVGAKKGEKIDYAICFDGTPTILVECKHWGQNLTNHVGQLTRYFTVSKARFGILTNGIVYKFYSDLDEPNKMDETPFLEFDITAINDAQIEELKKFHKSYFNLDEILTTATELKFTGAIKALLKSEMQSPTDDFVSYIGRRVYPTRVTQKIVEQFHPLVKKSFAQVVNELIAGRLSSAMKSEEDDVAAPTAKAAETETTVEQEPEGSKIVTTAEELEYFYTIRAMLQPHIPSSRVVHRDTESYFGILLDDNNRKPICRLQLTDRKKTLITFDEKKATTRHEIQSTDDLFAYIDQLVATAKHYDEPQTKADASESLQRKRRVDTGPGSIRRARLRGRSTCRV